MKGLLPHNLPTSGRPSGESKASSIHFTRGPLDYAVLGHEIAHHKLRHRDLPPRTHGSLAAFIVEMEAWNESLSKHPKEDLPRAAKFVEERLSEELGSVKWGKDRGDTTAEEYEKAKELYKEFQETWNLHR